MWRELRRRGDVEKVYGGVCAVENNGSVLRPFTERQTIADAAKRAICREAAKLLEDGDVVFVDSGTTMVHLVDNLANRPGVNHYHQQPCAGATGNPL